MLCLRHTTLVSTLTLSLGLLASACDKHEDHDDALAEDETETEGEPLGPEPCDQYNGMRECEDGEGTQFCGYIDAEMVWSECLVEFECLPGETRSCGLGEEFGDISQGCIVEEGEPHWNQNDCNTPLLLSFDAAPVAMQASSAAFDISGAGECLSTDWPAASNPWLAIDLDRNGAIDGGHELFGSGSVLASGRHASNGFIALASLDSNQDGKIDAQDQRFGELLAWRDEDGDKQSLPFELTTLREAGVLAIELDYAIDEQCDARGNCGRERSSFRFASGSGQVQVGEVVDMYLACQ
jgi:hypothetical protein